jgi:hypothetical protein
LTSLKDIRVFDLPSPPLSGAEIAAAGGETPS